MLLGVNMQTSFMHPPFGFALFYLRSVAARVPYLDKVTGKTIAPVTTGQIYWGAVPFVLIQVDHGGADHRLPADGHALQGCRGRSGRYTDRGPARRRHPTGLPGLGLPPLGEPPAQASPPGNGGAAPPATDLSQPPKFN